MRIVCWDAWEWSQVFQVIHTQKFVVSIPNMIKQESFMYDEDLDRLMIFNNLNNGEKVYGSINILNLVFDITNKNRIANIEIRNVSDYLRSIEKNPDILKNLTGARIDVSQVRGGFLMNIILISQNKTEKILYPIATEEKIIINA